MEEKILMLLGEMNQKLNKLDQKVDNIHTEMNQKFEELHEEMDQRFDKIYKEMDQRFSEVYQKMDHLRQEIFDRQIVFEDEYGTKIDAIFDYVQFHQKLNLERFDKINDLEKRVSALERKQV